jgi:hypothetical protein
MLHTSTPIGGVTVNEAEAKKVMVSEPTVRGLSVCGLALLPALVLAAEVTWVLYLIDHPRSPSGAGIPVFVDALVVVLIAAVISAGFIIVDDQCRRRSTRDQRDYWKNKALQSVDTCEPEEEPLERD